MNDNKGQTIFLSVIGIATLLVAIVGATFAWFSAQVTGNESASSVIVTTAKIASVTFTDGPQISNTTALPGWTATKDFTVAHPGGNNVAQTYIVYLTWSHTAATGKTTATDLNYTLTEADYQVDANGAPVEPDAAIDPDASSATIAAVTNIGAAGNAVKSEIARYTIPVGSTGIYHKYTFTITFPETGADQNSQQGATFFGTLSVELDGGAGTMYFNTSNPSGTITEPEAY